jgi:hypothetical protein
MKKSILLLLLMVSTNVLAEWTQVFIKNDNKAIGYIDLQSRRKKDNKVKIWVLYDFKEVQRYGNTKALSESSHFEFDCENETSQLLDNFTHTGNMRSGDIVLSETNIKNEPEPIIPGSFGETVFNFNCAFYKFQH